MNTQSYTYRYPHPAVATDCTVFGYDGKELHLLLIERGNEPFKGCWALPGGFLRMDETVEECAARELHEETNVKDLYLEQFRVFSDVDRDPRERILSVAFLALVRKSDYNVIAGDDASKAEWFRLDALPSLAFDHGTIISEARNRLREILRVKPVAFRLLDRKFTMSELQKLYEAINGAAYDRRNFQKKMLSTGFLREEGPCPDPMPCRPPQMYSFDEASFDAAHTENPAMKYPFNL